MNEINLDKKEKSTRGKFVDLRGQKFGRLTVLERDVDKENHEKGMNPFGFRPSYWLCRCSCGRMVSVRGSSLKNGFTKSCGCFQVEKQTKRYKDITGQKFGRLTVIEKTNKR